MTASGANAAKSNALIDWLVSRGLEGADNEELLDGYCNRLLDLGVPLMRFHAAQSALHPVYGGTGYSWYLGRGGDFQTFEYSESPSEVWRNIPLYAILNEALDIIRERLRSERIQPVPLIERSARAWGHGLLCDWRQF